MIDPSLLSPGALAAMAAAGDEVVALEAAMRAQGTSPRKLLVGDQPPAEFRHYPPGDVYDFASHSQYYFHVHREHEYGHLHLFLRPLGMPPGMVPAVAVGGADSPCQLIAVGLGANGFAHELFTTNRWVTGESWYKAADVVAMVPNFHVAVDGPLAPVGRWLTALVALYRPLVAALVEQRDEAVAAWSQAHPNLDPLIDPSLEITSHAAIDVGLWRQALAAARAQAVLEQ